jgi:hypothetical protein
VSVYSLEGPGLGKYQDPLNPRGALTPRMKFIAIEASRDFIFYLIIQEEHVRFVNFDRISNLSSFEFDQCDITDRLKIYSE